jgi:hypothetical protein
MPIQANSVSHVTVSKHIASSNPILPIITVEEVITNGTGTLSEVIQGGQVKILVELTAGEAKPAKDPLKEGDVVYVRGTRDDNTSFTLSGLITDSPRKPWKFSRVSGSTG